MKKGCCKWNVTAWFEVTQAALWITVLSANAAKELLVPYFHPVIESLKGFLTTTTEEMRSLQTQSLGRWTPEICKLKVISCDAFSYSALVAPCHADTVGSVLLCWGISLNNSLIERMDVDHLLLLLLDTLSVLARTIGKDVFSPLAAECVQLGLNLTDTIDDPDLRRCT